MKKFIKDEMNIKDIKNSLNLSEILYSGSVLNGINPIGNVIVLEYQGETVLDLAEKEGLDYFNNEYVVLSISKEEDSKRYIYLKQIPIQEV